jgi:hypothetical protein
MTPHPHPPEAATVEQIVDQLREHEAPSLLLLAHFSPDNGWLWVEVLDNCVDRKLAVEMLRGALEWYGEQ